MTEQTTQGSGAAKAPRVIKITDPQHLRQLHLTAAGAFLTPERCAEMVADFRIALEARMNQQQDAVQSVVAELFPETKDGDWVFDVSRMALIENVRPATATPAAADE